MIDDGREAWLKSLKKGDLVAVETRNIGSDRTYRVYLIKHITPSRRRFDLGYSDGDRIALAVDKTGYSKRAKWQPRDRIEAVTAETRAANALASTRRDFKAVIEDRARVQALTQDQMKRILSILEEGRDEKAGPQQGQDP